LSKPDYADFMKVILLTNSYHLCMEKWEHWFWKISNCPTIDNAVL